MADLKISELSTESPLTGTELVEVVTGGVNKKTTTQDIADLGGGGGHVIEDEGTPLTQRANMNFVGAGVTVTDVASKTTVTIPASISDTAYDATSWNGVTDVAPSKNAVRDIVETLAASVIDQAVPSTSGSTITLDMNSQVQRSFVGSATFATPKTLAVSNVPSGSTQPAFFNFIFEVTSTAAVITMPSDFVMSTINWDGTDWTPPATGKYEIGGSFDQTNNIWYAKISGPFS